MNSAVLLLKSDRTIRALSALLVLALAGGIGLPAVCAENPSDRPVGGKTVGTEVVVQPGKWSIGRLRNVSDNVDVSLWVLSPSPVVLFVLTEAQLDAFPKVPDPVLMGQVDGRFEAKTHLAAGGNHYLLFWNKTGTQPLTLRFAARFSPAAP